MGSSSMTIATRPQLVAEGVGEPLQRVDDDRLQGVVRGRACRIHGCTASIHDRPAVPARVAGAVRMGPASRGRSPGYH